MATLVYDITDKAGPYIAGIRLTPGQTQITLTAEQAAYELDQGTITPTGLPGPSPETPAPVLATDRVEMRRGGLNTRPTAAELAAFVQEQRHLLSTDSDVDLKGQRLFNGRVRINSYTASLTLAAADKGACVIVTHAAARSFTLPADWAVGDCVVVRRGGAGALSWALETGATLALPASKAGHVGIAEQHEEALFKVVSNAGAAAVWAVSGATS
ncbi:MAG: hypothetical protein DI527_07775 [Chelatococcus sp.]|nr:MAG: hypothetical protein DI527_07775 [Chelatococcus sp.]